MLTTTNKPAGLNVGPAQTAVKMPGDIVGVIGQTSRSSSQGVSGPEEMAPASMPLSASLSPASLLAYCQSRLQSLDSQMNNIFSSQTQNATETTDVNAIASAMNDLPAATGSPATISPEPGQVQAIDAAYQTAITDAGGPTTQLGAALSTDQKNFDAAANGKTPLSGDAVTGFQQSLKNYAADLNSNSETTMITLQSLMSQRQTAVQLTTGLVQALGDQQNAIAKNIGS